MNKVRWGVLSTAKIARTLVIPAMQNRPQGDVVALASRDEAHAKETARKLGIPRAYGSYEALLADPDVDAVFNPLPNHMHLEWTVKAMEAGKHVLCEKPLTLNAAEARTLRDVARQHPELKVMEAFMYRFHVQWRHARKIVSDGGIGELRTIQSFFSYYNTDPANIRNIADAGGGTLLDIGCYCLSLSRFIFGYEPERILGTMAFDPVMKTDRLISGVLDFGNRYASFTCSTQVKPYQRVHIIGTIGRIEIEIPFNAPVDQPCRMWIERGDRSEEKVFEVCNQYAEQGDRFNEAVLNDAPVPTPLDDAVNNMIAIDAFRKSAEVNAWVAIK